MAELMDDLEELKALPEQLHILCPRQNDLDMQPYNDIAIQSTNPARADVKPNVQNLDRIAEATTRREKFLSCMRLLAFSGEDVEIQQQWIWNRLERSLENCDLCIKEYYRGKVWLMDMLGEAYEETEVKKFGEIIDERDIRRIVGNLDRAAETLKAHPPQQRNLSVLDRAAMLSIFEALSNEAMLGEEEIMRAHFDEPFRLVQSNRTLKIPDYTPAATRFLFETNQQRLHWAVACWGKMPRPPTTPEFDWAVKEPLLRAIRHASTPPIQPELIRRLWAGVYVIVKRLDKEQITHNLRALEIDPCRLSVDHLAVPTPGLRSLLNTIQILLEKAAGDFWDAMHTISPQAIIEQVFYNPQYDAFLLQTPENESYDTSSPLRDVLSWIEPFMASLKGAHQPQACRFFVFQLLNRLQDPKFPAIARYHCFRIGLSVLISTLRTFTDNEATRGSVARVVLSDTLEVISDNINHFLEPPSFPVEGSKNVIDDLCKGVIRNTLALECQSLKSDYEAIQRKKSLGHGVSTYSPKIWDAVVQHLHEDNLGLSTAALMGILPLVGLEKFSTKGDHSKEKTHFNVIYGHLTHLACQILERLADFKAEHLDDLFKSQDTSSALISALFSADLNTYQAAVDLIKAISLQSGRKEAISHLLQSFCATTMYGFSWSFRRISNMKTFSPAPRMIKTGMDILDVLCDTQTGILRTRKLADRREFLTLQRLWEYQWLALITIFEHTETWHMMGIDRNVMLEFCRDAIQFADLLFDQFTVFASSMADFDPSQAKSTKEGLLKSPTTTMNVMVKWLRLKDDYLATTLVGLVSKLLRRLGELDVTLSPGTLEFIEGVALKGTVKTILTEREKAELVRALEAYYKKPLVTVQPTPAPKKKQTMITSFAKPIDLTGVSSPSRISTSDDDEFDDDIPDDVLMQLSSSVELNKARIAAQKRPEKPGLPLTKPAPRLIKPVPNVLSFREKREREKEEKKKRDMLELAKLKKKMPSQTSHQGSGIKGLNVNISDHTPVESMMVSSDSDSDSDSEEETDGDNVGRKTASKPDAVKAYEESRKKQLNQRGPVKKVKVVRSAKDMRARLSPDLSMLHKTLLSWDFFASGDLPPNSDRTDYTLVSNTFSDAMDYQKTFEPLLVLEAWQGFQSAKEEGSFKPFEIKVSNRMSVDAFIEVTTFMQPDEARNLGLGESDLVLLSKSSDPASDSRAPHCLARIFRSSKKKGIVEIAYRLNPTSLLISSILPGASLFGIRVTSLTPLEREYGALMALRYYDLSDEVIKAKPSPILNYTPESLKPIIGTYNVNPAQAKAVKSAMDNDAFTLIQGPPGSGKTKTIVALVGAILTPMFSEHKIARPGASNFKPATRVTTAKKLLVCAPSNAAVDELVMRFKEGITTLNGQKQNISVIRLGRSDAINSNVIDVTLDELVNAKLSQTGRKNGEKDLQTIYLEHKETSTQFNQVRERLDQHRAQGQPITPELEREFDLLKRKKAQLSQAIDNARDSNQAAARNADLARKKVQQEIIDGAHVICSTLSGSGHDMFQSLSIEFETVVIDEAAQSIELSALIPLKYGCSKCILVGDPKQLPPTVLSKEASRFQYEQSLFVRMQANHPNDVHLLDTQYRMHPEISRFPSAAFYDSRLQDGPDMAKLRARPWHGSELLGPYRFFDVQGMHSSAPKGHSLVNMAEIYVAMKLYERLTSDYRTYDFTTKIGIITPYKGQLREMKNQFANKYGNSIFTTVEFNTTDAFQGRECEVIIFSCVRASNRGIGFLADIRRMNVGLTRAKSSLWVLGNSQSLVQGEFWRGLITDAHSRQLYTEGDVLKLLQTPQISVDTELNDVEMVDAPMSAKSSTPSRTGSMTPGGNGSSRPSSALSIGRLSSIPDTHPPSSRDTPNHSPRVAPTVTDGPSGGRYGLDERAMCGLCGSYEHMTPNCDNIDAKKAARGTCYRCGDASHTKRDCTAERCLQCGAFGHSARTCKATVPLAKRDRDRIIREEKHHSDFQKANLERQRKRQLGDHDPKVPTIMVPSSNSMPMATSKATAPPTVLSTPKSREVPNTNKGQGSSGKRKRTEPDRPNATMPQVKKVRKPDAAFNAQFGPPPTAPKGPRGRKLDPQSVAPPSSDLVIPSKTTGPGYQPINPMAHAIPGVGSIAPPSRGPRGAPRGEPESEDEYEPRGPEFPNIPGVGSAAPPDRSRDPRVGQNYQSRDPRVPAISGPGSFPAPDRGSIPNHGNYPQRDTRDPRANPISRPDSAGNRTPGSDPRYRAGQGNRGGNPTQGPPQHSRPPHSNQNSNPNAPPGPRADGRGPPQPMRRKKPASVFIQPKRR